MPISAYPISGAPISGNADSAPSAVTSSVAGYAGGIGTGRSLGTAGYAFVGAGQDSHGLVSDGFGLRLGSSSVLAAYGVCYAAEFTLQNISSSTVGIGTARAAGAVRMAAPTSTFHGVGIAPASGAVVAGGSCFTNGEGVASSPGSSGYAFSSSSIGYDSLSGFPAIVVGCNAFSVGMSDSPARFAEVREILEPDDGGYATSDSGPFAITISVPGVSCGLSVSFAADGTSLLLTSRIVGIGTAASPATAYYSFSSSTVGLGSASAFGAGTLSSGSTVAGQSSTGGDSESTAAELAFTGVSAASGASQAFPALCASVSGSSVSASVAATPAAMISGSPACSSGYCTTPGSVAGGSGGGEVPAFAVCYLVGTVRVAVTASSLASYAFTVHVQNNSTWTP